MAGTSVDLQRFLLTEIVAPSITSTNYASALSESFNNIDDNFRKPLSVPFLQGADAKNFKLEKISLFENPENAELNTPLSAWGRSIVYSILESGNQEFDAGLKDNLATLEIVNEYVENNLDKVPSYRPSSYTESGETYYRYATDSLIDSPYIYAYVIRDDKGDVTNQFVAQYMRFIDARIEGIQLDSKDIDFEFEELSCFLIHTPGNVGDLNDIGHWERVYITPTIYYNRDVQEWQWKIDGQKTGLPAQGVKGDNGEPGPRSWIVSIQKDSQTLQSTTPVTFVFTTSDANEGYSWYPVGDPNIRQQVESMRSGDLVYALAFDDGDPKDGDNYKVPEDMIFSVLSVHSETPAVVFNQGLSFDEYLKSIKLTDYFMNIGLSGGSDPASGPRGLFFKSIPYQGGNSSQVGPFHMLYALYRSRVNDGNEDLSYDIHVGLTNDVNVAPGDEEETSLLTQGRFVLDNYCLHACQVLLTEPGLLRNESDQQGKEVDNGNIREKLKTMLNVYGGTYLNGNVEIALSDSGSFEVSGGTESSSKIQSASIEFVGGGNQNLTIDKNGVSVSLNSDQSETYGQFTIKTKEGVILASRSKVKKSTRRGRRQTFEHAIEIPKLDTTELTNINTTTQKIKVGDFCLIDSTAKNRDQVNADFDEIKFSSENSTKSSGDVNIPIEIDGSVKKDMSVSSNSDVKIVLDAIGSGGIGFFKNDEMRNSYNDCTTAGNINVTSKKDIYLYFSNNIGSKDLFDINNIDISSLKNAICQSNPSVSEGNIKKIYGKIYIKPVDVTGSLNMIIEATNPSSSHFSLGNTSGTHGDTTISGGSGITSSTSKIRVFCAREATYKTVATSGGNKIVGYAGQKDGKEVIIENVAGKKAQFNFNGINKTKILSDLSEKIEICDFEIDEINSTKRASANSISFEDIKYKVNFGQSTRFSLYGKLSDTLSSSAFKLVTSSIKAESGSLTMNYIVRIEITKYEYNYSSDACHFVICPLGIIAKKNGDKKLYTPSLIEWEN